MIRPTFCYHPSVALMLLCFLDTCRFFLARSLLHLTVYKWDPKARRKRGFYYFLLSRNSRVSPIECSWSEFVPIVLSNGRLNDRRFNPLWVYSCFSIGYCITYLRRIIQKRVLTLYLCHKSLSPTYGFCSLWGHLNKV